MFVLKFLKEHKRLTSLHRNDSSFMYSESLIHPANDRPRLLGRDTSSTFDREAMRGEKRVPSQMSLRNIQTFWRLAASPSFVTSQES